MVTSEPVVIDLDFTDQRIQDDYKALLQTYPDTPLRQSATRRRVGFYPVDAIIRSV